MKTIGLLGGLPWQESLAYYRELHEKTSNETIMFSFDYNTMESFRKRHQWETISKEMIYQAQQLKEAGADYLIICSDMYHKVYNEIKSNTTLKMIHLVEAIGRQLVEERLSKILLLTHRDMIHDSLYADVLKGYGIEVIIPDLEHINRIEHLLLGDEDDYMKLIGLLESYSIRGVGGIVYSGSVYESIKKEDLSMKVFSTMSVHINDVLNQIKRVK